MVLVMFDELDLKILDELYSRGWQRATVLASALGVGERTIYRRIRNMRRKGIFDTIPVPNPVLLGYKAWANIGIKVSPGYLYNVVRNLLRQNSIYGVHLCLGRFPIMAVVMFETFDMLTFFVNSELQAIEGIRSIETLPYIYPRKYYQFFWPAPSFRKTAAGWERCPDVANNDFYQIDEINQKILNVLIHEGITRPASLKSRLGIGEGTIRRRLNKMLDGGLFEIEVVLNPALSPYEVWPIMGINIEERSAHEVIDDLLKKQAVYLASVSIGRFDIIIGARFHNMDLLTHFVNIELPAIKGVASVETFLAIRTLKYHGIDWSYLMDEHTVI